MYNKKKRSLQQFVDMKIQNFKNVFDISEESILILSNKNEIFYANDSMMHLLNLEKHFIYTVLPIPKIKVKGEWKNLDEIIMNRSKKVKNNLQVHI